jgi:hypothetical protein
MVALGSSPLSLLSGAAATASAVVGVYIGYQAYRGFSRNDDPAMRYLSAGMVLLFGVTYVVAVLGQGLLAFAVSPIAYQDLFRLVVRVLQLAGLSLIAYSLHVATSRGGPSG